MDSAPVLSRAEISAQQDFASIDFHKKDSKNRFVRPEHIPQHSITGLAYTLENLRLGYGEAIEKKKLDAASVPDSLETLQKNENSLKLRSALLKNALSDVAIRWSSLGGFSNGIGDVPQFKDLDLIDHAVALDYKMFQKNYKAEKDLVVSGQSIPYNKPTYKQADIGPTFRDWKERKNGTTPFGVRTWIDQMLDGLEESVDEFVDVVDLDGTQQKFPKQEVKKELQNLLNNLES